MCLLSDVWHTNSPDIPSESITVPVMLAAKRLPEVLKSVLNDDIDGCVLMTEEGSVLAEAFTEKSHLIDTSLAAISSSIWGNIRTGSPDVSLHMIQLERGCLGITTAGKGYILAIYGETLALGLLRGRLDTLSAYFTRMFDQLK